MKKLLTFTPYVALLLFVAIFMTQEPKALPAFAATNAIESPVALFQTSLANSISATASSMTLVSGLTKDGTTLASSTYSFILDEGTASQEFVIADCTGTSCTNMQRGLSVNTGTTTVAVLEKIHRRGASVKMTDAPVLIKAVRALNGILSLPNPLKYNSISTATLGLDSNNVASVGYANSLAFGAVPAASESASGFAQLATQTQAASSTSLGSTGARLVLPASIATSTYNAATAPLRVVVTNNSGVIDSNFLGPNAPPTGSLTMYASSTAPTGWLLADGSAVSRATYASLFGVIGTYYGYGDNSTTFNVPDLRTSVPLGNGAKVLVATTSALTGVNTGTDLVTITSPANDWLQTGEAVAVTGAALPSGITAGTYYVIRVSATTLKLASSLANAQNGTQVDITATGTGTMTMTETLTNHSIGYQGGEEAHAQSSTELLSHSHTFNVYTANAGGSPSPNGGTQTFSGGTVTTSTAGGNAAANVLNPYTVVNYIIKY